MASLLALTLLAGLQTATLRAETSLPVISSEFTNMIISVKVGHPPQDLPLGISFDRKDPWLYSLGECPPYVTCYRNLLSEGFEFGGQERFFSGPRGTLEGFNCIDWFRVSDDLVFSSDFAHINSASGLSIAGRDTAGQMAFGPNSQVALRNIFEIKVDLPTAGKLNRALPRWSLVLKPEVPTSPTGSIEIAASVTPHSPGWKLGAKIYVNGTEVFRRIPLTFVPDMDDLVIPESDQTAVLARLIPSRIHHKIAYGGRLFISCRGTSGPANTEALGKIGIRFYPDTSRLIYIHPQTLQYTGLLNTRSVINEDSLKYCPTRIVFKANTRGWSVGIPLAASVISARFDAPNRRVTFTLTGNGVVPSTPTSVAGYNPIPRFTSPEVVRSGSGLHAKVSVRFSSGWSRIGGADSSDLVLFNQHPETEGDGGLFRYTFLKMRESLLHPKLTDMSVTELDEVVQIKRLEARQIEDPNEGSVISFDFIVSTDPASASYSVTVIETSFTVQVVLSKAETLIDLKHYDIPKGSKATAEDELDRCSVCLDQFVKGEVIQALPCGDKYHPACVERWLGKNRKCAACRREIGLKSEAGTFLLKRVTTPEPEEFELTVDDDDYDY